MLLFADDTNALITGSNIDEMIRTINAEHDKIYRCLCMNFLLNKLSLNITKTPRMVFNVRRNVFHDSEHVCIKIKIFSKLKLLPLVRLGSKLL